MPLQDTVKQGAVAQLIVDVDLASTTNRDYTGIVNGQEDGDPNDPGRLLFSDSPETFQRRYSDAQRTAILWDDFDKVLFYSSKIPANTKFRVYVDHVNGGYTWEDTSVNPHLIRTFPGSPTVPVNVWIGNTSKTNAANVTASAMGEGASGLIQISQYLNEIVPGPPGTSNILVPANRRVIVGGSPALAPNSNYNLVWDFETDSDIEVFVTNGNLDLNNYLVTPPPTAELRGHVRGVFEGWNVIKGFSTAVALTPSASTYHTVRVGANGATVTSRPGMDYTTPSSPPVSVDDRGIFGVRYRIDIPVSNSTVDPLCYGIVLNPRAYPVNGIVGDIGAGTVVQNPTGMTHNYQGVIISKSKTPLAPHEQATKRFYYMIPSGNSTPVEFVVVPFSSTGSSCS